MRFWIIRATCLLSIVHFYSPLIARSAEISSFADPSYPCEYCVSSPHISCLLKGTIQLGDFEKVQTFIGQRTSAYNGAIGYNKLKCESLYLHSPGGSYYEGLKIMKYLHDSMISTTVRDGDTCLSACALIWLGGARPDGHSLDNPHTDRRIAARAVLGFHAPFPPHQEGDFPSSEVSRAFVEAFSVAQEMLGTFARYRIPLWFAVNLMHADKDTFFYIDNIEKSNLIGATFVMERTPQLNVTLEFLLHGCFNLSHWGKGRSAYVNLSTEYSRNSDTTFDFSEYTTMVRSGILRQLSFKFMDSIQYFIPNTPAKATSAAMDAIDARSDSAYQGSSRLAFFEYLSELLGAEFSAIPPGILVYTSKTDTYPVRWYLFPSPGVVGPDDENVRDRGELCLFVEEKTYDGRGKSGKFYGTEINDFTAPQNLPVPLLGISPDTKLVDASHEIDRISNDEAIRRSKGHSNSQPGWCRNASTEVERLICSDKTLSDLDILYAARYETAKQTTPEPARQIAKSTRDARKQCRLDPECIARVYQDAIIALQAR